MNIQTKTLRAFAKTIKAIDASLFGMVKDTYEYKQAEIARKALMNIISVQGYELSLEYRLIQNVGREI